MAEAAIREYRRGDVPAMYALDMECFAPVFRFSERAMRRFAEAEGAITLLAENDGKLAGFAIVQIEPSGDRAAGYVVTLDVAPAWRGKGLGRRLMAEMERRAAAAGASVMELHVYDGNAAALRLYEAIGYAKAGVRPGFYGRGLDAVVYRKQLRR